MVLFLHLDPDFLASEDVLNQCPLPTIRWCVVDYWEMEKCERMSSAFAAKSIKPDLTCILEETIIDCMRRTRDGFVDMMNVEAGDLYTAGSQFNLVPIVNE